MNQSFDYLIVGQGLAGSLLAFELIEKGAKVLVFDNPNGPSSSKVAAGIFNPVTGKRFVKTWLCDEIYPNIIPFYESLEAKFGVKILHKLPILRPIESVKEQNQIIELADDPENESYVSYEQSPVEIKELTDSKFGVLSTKIGGWVDVPLFLETIKKYLLEKTSCINQVVEYEQFMIGNDSVNYQKFSFKKVIFCEGYSTINNPYFNWLPFNAVKGEVLNLKMDATLKNFILLKGIFVVPNPNGTYKVGATYNWVDKTSEITKDGRGEIEEKLRKLTKIDCEFVSQSAGIRPATVDRRPFLGLHPKFNSIGIFNGLGTKGVSLGPYFAQHFANFLINNEQLNSDVNINRFSSLYLSSDSE
jgi:glycine/D-amino acid oxidase-like deaminating enzyme